MTFLLFCIHLVPPAQCRQGAQGQDLCVCVCVGICEVEDGDLRVRRESAPLSPFGRASLRRQTQPLRGYIRRRLARGACRPPSIPPNATAFERVHAFAWERSVP